MDTNLAIFFGIRKIKCFTFSSYFELEFITSKKRGKNAFSRSFDRSQFLKLLVQCILNLLIIAEFSKKMGAKYILCSIYIRIFKKFYDSSNGDSGDVN